MHIFDFRKSGDPKRRFRPSKNRTFVEQRYFRVSTSRHLDFFRAHQNFPGGYRDVRPVLLGIERGLAGQFESCPAVCAELSFKDGAVETLSDNDFIGRCASASFFQRNPTPSGARLWSMGSHEGARGLPARHLERWCPKLNRHPHKSLLSKSRGPPSDNSPPPAPRRVASLPCLTHLVWVIRSAPRRPTGHRAGAGLKISPRL